MLQNRNTGPVPEHQFPIAEHAAQLYEFETGGHLTRPSADYVDSPFPSEAQRQQADHEFGMVCPAVEVLMDATVNRHFGPFKQAILTFIHIVERHCTRRVSNDGSRT